MRTLELKIESYNFSVPVFEKDGKIWVALKPLCETLGVARFNQQKKVRKSDTIMWYDIILHDSIGREQSMLCIEIDSIGEWIFSINPKKVKPELVEKLMVFRKKLQVVLYQAVTGVIDPNMVHKLTEQVETLTRALQEQQEELYYLKASL